MTTDGLRVLFPLSGQREGWRGTFSGGRTVPNLSDSGRLEPIAARPYPATVCVAIDGGVILPAVVPANVKEAPASCQRS